MEPRRGDNSHMTSSTADVECSIISQCIQCSGMVFKGNTILELQSFAQAKNAKCLSSMQSGGTCQPLQSETVSARSCLIFRDVNCVRHRGKSQRCTEGNRWSFSRKKCENRIDTTVKGGFQKVHFHCRRFRKILGNLPSGWLCCSCGGEPLDDVISHQGKPPNAKTEMCNILREYYFLQLLEMCSYRVFPSIFLVPIFYCKLCLCTHRCGNKY